MSRATDTQNLQVDAAGVADGGFEVGTVLGGVIRKAVRDVDVSRRNIQMAEEVFFHEESVRLRVRRAKAFVFVEIEGDDRAETHARFTMKTDELSIERERGGTCRESQHRRLARFRAYLNQVGYLPGNRLRGGLFVGVKPGRDHLSLVWRACAQSRHAWPWRRRAVCEHLRESWAELSRRTRR